MAERRVRGSVFVDYVRMIRARKDVDYVLHLPAQDLRYLSEHIEPQKWYPMETFERLGNYILRQLIGGGLEAVRMWGRVQTEELHQLHPNLVVEGDARESLIRFGVLRSGLFDFNALEVTNLGEHEAEVVIQYHMGAAAEEAACYQAMGFLERLLEVAGAKEVETRFLEASWHGAKATRLSLRWREASSLQPPDSSETPQ